MGKKLLLFAASLAFCLLVLELFVRATWQSQWRIPKEAARAPGIFTARLKADAELDIPLMDGGSFHVTTNARGFRGPLVSSIAGKPLRIVSVGDSYTFGWGTALADQAMSRFVESYRKAHPDRDVGHAYVAGASWDPRDYYFGYLTEAREAKPDLVVLGVYTGNDVMPADAPRWLDPAQAPDVQTIPESPRPWLRSMEWLGTQLSSNLFAVKAGLRGKQEAAVFAPFDPDMDRQRKLWETSFFYIDALHAAVKKDGGRLAILLYPTLLQVSSKDQLERAGYDHAMPEKLFSTLCQERGIGLVTILDALEKDGERRDLYFPRDRHLTVQGNAVAAKVLDEKLAPVVDRLWDERAGKAQR